MKRANCYVVVNCRDNPQFGGEYETTEDVYEAYDKYPSFTQRIFSSLRAAKKEMNYWDKNVIVGGECYVVCGCYCKQFDC
jgi:hypothetical protein